MRDFITLVFDKYATHIRVDKITRIWDNGDKMSIYIDADTQFTVLGIQADRVRSELGLPLPDLGGNEAG